MRLLNLLKYVILGIIQGITEPLPISSSGHIFILKNAFKTNIINDLNFEIIVNTGSLLAVLILYRNELIELIKDFFKYSFNKTNDSKQNFDYIIKVIVGVFPILICGLFLKDYIENKLTDISIVGYGYLITAILLFMNRNKKGTKSSKDLTIPECLKIGITSIIALIPGISRSGTSYVAGLNQKLERKEALKYSFMMYIPVSFGTLILGIKDLFLLNKETIVLYLISFICSFIASYFSLKWFVNKVTTNNLKYFALYCALIGIIVILA